MQLFFVNFFFKKIIFIDKVGRIECIAKGARWRHRSIWNFGIFRFLYFFISLLVFVLFWFLIVVTPHNTNQLDEEDSQGSNINQEKTSTIKINYLSFQNKKYNSFFVVAFSHQIRKCRLMWRCTMHAKLEIYEKWNDCWQLELMWMQIFMTRHLLARASWSGAFFARQWSRDWWNWCMWVTTSLSLCVCEQFLKSDCLVVRHFLQQLLTLKVWLLNFWRFEDQNQKPMEG